MGVLARQQPYVKRHPRSIAQTLKKVLHKLSIEGTNTIGGDRAVKGKVRPTGKVKHNLGKGFVQRCCEAAKPVNTLARAQGTRQRSS